MDFNSDENIDLIIGTTGGIRVLLGDGAGGFSLVNSPAFNGSGVVPVRLAVGDFNRDGRLDLVAADAGVVSVFFGDGQGAFPVSASYGGVGSSLLVTDINSDQLLDLVVGSTSSLHLFFGNGTNIFASRTALSVSSADSVAAADLNGDKKLDLIVSSRVTLPNSPFAKTTVLFGDGLGAFPTSAIYPAGCAASGDFNGDKKPDLMISPGSGVTSVFLGNGAGSFTSSFNIATGSSACPAVGDFNADQKPDLALVNGAGVFLLNNQSP